ncbi:MAG: universal stress protein [Erythrobacter sp.]|uniref:universal stress protein n=1 Tax=Erythrobacter sp. TaxID=1042 RepID=UPI0026287E1E|nr:universal stress protein [Erythrobacter sp.]MDJ0977595.1 universal stress protein [Erythrobacter sp.]
MRSILLHVYDDKAFEARLQVALDFVRHFKGRITCAQAAPYDYGVPTDFYGAMSAEMVVDYEKTATRSRGEIEQRLAGEGVSWVWKSSRGAAVGLIGSCAPLHDVVIVGSNDPLGFPGSPSRFVGELIERVRAPILVVPESVRSFDFGAPAVVAWNGAPECAHALRAALPALRQASCVHVLQVAEKKKKKYKDKFDLPSTQALEYLAQHDLKSELIELQREKGDSIAETLMKAAHAREAGFIVMGAYGHSRFRERMLGGVTRSMLSDPRLPLLLAH